MKFKKLCSLLLVTTMTCSLFATPVYATPSATEDKQKAMAEQEALEAQKQATEGEMNALQTQLSTLMTQINELQIQLMEKGQQIVQAEADLKVAEEKRQQQYEDMKLRIKYMYESGDSSTMERIFASGTISEMLAQAEYVQKVHEYDREQLQEYVNTVEEVKELKTTLETEMDALEEMEVEYQNQSDELNNMIIEKSSEIENLDEMIQAAAAEVAEAAAREEAERLAAIEAAAQAAAAAQQNNNNASNNSNNTSNNNNNTSNNNNNTSNNNTSNSNTSNNNNAADNNTNNDSGSNSSNSGTTSSSSKPEPSYNASTGNAIVDRAYSCLGAEYVWGACSPGAFDCSGLVSYCLTGSYTRLGTTTTFYGWPRVSNPQPGDVCVKIGHTGIYIGGGQMIHAATFGVGVIIGPVQSGMVYVRR